MDAHGQVTQLPRGSSHHCLGLFRVYCVLKVLWLFFYIRFFFFLQFCFTALIFIYLWMLCSLSDGQVEGDVKGSPPEDRWILRSCHHHQRNLLPSWERAQGGRTQDLSGYWKYVSGESFFRIVILFKDFPEFYNSHFSRNFICIWDTRVKSLAGDLTPQLHTGTRLISNVFYISCASLCLIKTVLMLRVFFRCKWTGCAESQSRDYQANKGGAHQISKCYHLLLHKRDAPVSSQCWTSHWH